MTTTTDHTELEQRLREAFQRQAAATPLPTPEPSTTVNVPLTRSPRPRRPLAVRLTLAASAAAALAVIAIVATRSSNEATPASETNTALVETTDTTPATTQPDPTTTRPPPAAFQPTGTEVPIATVDVPADFAPFGGGDTATATALAVDGHPAVVKYRTVAFLGGHLQQFTCFTSGGGSGCTPDWNADTPSLTQTSDVANGLAAFDLFAWYNVPDGVEYVSWQSPDGLVWQQPIDGVVAFPVAGRTAWNSPITIGDQPLTAFDADGNVIDSFTWKTVGARTPAEPEPMIDNLTDEQRTEIIQLVDASLQQCLANATWDQCFAHVSAIAQARFDELGGTVTTAADPPASPTTAVGIVGSDPVP